ncbi:hypothetical protein D8B26_002052 [Coccidioides posadasii str. Silveira]|uniref:Uncharacterized protein n=2 Tax=Coccidioides posadasii TaxID=199306 RepID=E9CXC3_COCPS|nr:hypothetical protein CPC735_052640 [Coccidioides posadasii C735 delta SOWgp]EER23894.1 hypothetical protein CPC735_052640 [Coccidioides posadasii C735 delta SOWgp]EFW21949.1 conserved hypothetical protein [Coccidioides posadasii str. Silveira]QVM07351.1 hypothetical protein D8B26_002052 [Coccidioides posadasii str. Silveira]|eukprot:XP_003066039.1 hypothetical protein CPC735_052640 [Coccidioides posadasii C735 delta SOWgp]
MSTKPGVSSSGITTNTATGERHVPSSIRADGSVRREIRIRPGYRPPEDVELYKNKATESWKSRIKAGVPGAEGLKDGDSKPSTAASAKNAKRREAKKKAKSTNEAMSNGAEDNKANGGIMAQGNWRNGPPGGQEAEASVDPEVEREKKARNLKKKLKQARELRDKKDNGENLLPEQFEKVIRIKELIRQLDALGFDSEGEKKVKGPTTTKEQGDAV